MTDYKSLKVPELKTLLQERSLAVSGNKAELIARLEEHDRSKAPATAPAEAKPSPSTSPTTASKPAPAASTSNAAIAPPAEDEIDWDDEGTSAAPAPAVAPAKAREPASASATAPAPEAKPIKTGSAAAAAIALTKRKAAAAPKAAPKAAPPKADDVKPSTDDGVAPKESTPGTDASESAKKVYAAGLAMTDAMKELELRKKRAERFNQPDTLAEINKKIEELKKSSEGTTESKPNSAITTKIDKALPEKNMLKGRKRRMEAEEKPGERAGKRRNVPDATGNGRGGRGRGNNNQAQSQSKEAPKKYGKVTDDPTERAKAEARAKRFGTEIPK